MDPGKDKKDPIDYNANNKSKKQKKAKQSNKEDFSISIEKEDRKSHLSILYRKGLYEVSGLGIQIQIGHRNALLENLLTAFGSTHWAYITAWNPKSVQFPPEENERRQMQLLELIETEALAFFYGWGKGLEGDWPPEASFLILGIDRVLAIEWASLFDQNAFLFGEKDMPAELIWC